VDSYQLEPGSLRKQTGARRLACMHDVGPLTDGADFTLTTDPALAGTRPGVVGGLALTCLGPAYWGLPDPPEPPDHVRRALVTMGGGDPGGHAVAVAQTVREALGPGVEVTVVRGPQANFADPPGMVVLDRPPSLLAPLRAADLTVTACGSSLLEALAVGTPTIGVVLAANQRPKAEEIARQGATELLEPAAHQALAEAVGALAADARARRARSQAGSGLEDGYGALRVAYRLSELLSPA
jgi:UDP:flavonoid glycosyltransferase YjiC (YdhE family)